MRNRTPSCVIPLHDYGGFSGPGTARCVNCGQTESAGDWLIRTEIEWSSKGSGKPVYRYRHSNQWWVLCYPKRIPDGFPHIVRVDNLKASVA